MKRQIFLKSAMAACVAAVFFFSVSADAYWVWTPGSKKFINPKYAAKDSPKEQFDWAMSFYNAKDYQRAAQEFEKVTKVYEYSEYASKAQYYVGLSYENMNKFYMAYENYQKAIDNFPHIENMDEIVAREFNIAGIYASKGSPKVLGVDIMTSLDRAIEIYRKVVDNAPYGRLSDEAQYNMAATMKKAERFDEAIPEFQKILDDYPTSRFVDKAKFEVADCAYRASLKPAYDVEPTAKAIKAFEDFTRENRDKGLIKEADKTVQRLKDKAASKSLMTAQFYERQGRYKAAMIYYQDMIDSYPDSTLVNGARAKVAEMNAKLNRPKKSIVDMFRKEPRPVKTTEKQVEAAAEKKPWSFFGLGKPKPKEAVSETPAKKGWAPFKFTGPAKPKKEPVEKKPAAKKPWRLFSFSNYEPQGAVSEAPAKKGWAPFKFTGPAKPKKTPVEKKPVEKKPWSFFGLGKSKPKEAAPEVPAKKGWTPLKLTKPARAKEGARQTIEEKVPEVQPPAAEEKPQAAIEEKPQAAAATEAPQRPESVTETQAPEEDMEMIASQAQEKAVEEDPDAQIEKSEY